VADLAGDKWLLSAKPVMTEPTKAKLKNMKKIISILFWYFLGFLTGGITINFFQHLTFK
jgi:hypothetical protein